MHRYLALAASATMMFAAPATAATWIHFYTAPAGSVWSYDLDTIDQTADGSITVWARSNERRNPRATYRWAKRLFELNCAARTITPRGFLLYNARGEVTRNELSATRRGQALLIAPGTMSEALFDQVCDATAGGRNAVDGSAQRSAHRMSDKLA